jgi:hypothetical protein
MRHFPYATVLLLLLLLAVDQFAFYPLSWLAIVIHALRVNQRKHNGPSLMGTYLFATHWTAIFRRTPSGSEAWQTKFMAARLDAYGCDVSQITAASWTK